MPPQQTAPVPVPENPQNDPKSFKLYTGKAPILVQIVAGLQWLGAAAMIFYGLGNLLTLHIVLAIVCFGLAALFIMTAQSFFKMKKVALRNALILLGVAVVVVGIERYTTGAAQYGGLFIPMLLVLLAYNYRAKMLN